MKFGGRKGAGAEESSAAPAPSITKAVPFDFMCDGSWSSLVTPMLRGDVNARSLANLPRRDRDYAYRVVSHPESPIPVVQTQAWYRDAPSAATTALAGAAKVRDAHRMLRGRPVSLMSELESERFCALLADADSLLLNACMRYPDSAMPWIPRIDVARGLGLGPDEVMRRFTEAQSRERWSFLAAEATMQGLLPRWSGSYELMFRLAADAVASTPAGSPVRSIAASAEAERVLNDPHQNPAFMPSRSGLDFSRLLFHYVYTLPDEIDPDDVVALGAFLFAAAPRDSDEAKAVLRALDLLRGRCAGQPYASVEDPIDMFGRTLSTREREAKALLD